MHVFLDIDGVLATEATWDRWFADGGRPDRRGLLFDEDCVKHVQALCERLDAKVVVSSSWRELYSWEALVGLLRGAGLRAPIVGVTPLHPDRHRGAEIAAWMASHGLEDGDVLVLEDWEDVSPLQHRQVQPEFLGERAGFRREHLLAALAIAGVA